MNPIEALKSQQNQLLESIENIVLKSVNNTSERINITSALQNIINKCYQFLELETALSWYEFDCKRSSDDQSFSQTFDILNHFIKNGVALADSISIFDWFILKSEVFYFLNALAKPNIINNELDAVVNAFNLTLIKDYSLNDGLCVDIVNRTYNQAISSLKDMNYNDYLRTNHWKNFSNEARNFFGKKCSQCDTSINLNVHHNNYTCLGKETFSDVCLLCNSCHNMIHSKP